jgi:hypothetical protein
MKVWNGSDLGTSLSTRNLGTHIVILSGAWIESF